MSGREILRPEAGGTLRQPIHGTKKGERRALSPGARLSADLAEFVYCGPPPRPPRPPPPPAPAPPAPPPAPPRPAPPAGGVGCATSGCGPSTFTSAWYAHCSSAFPP